MNLIPKPCPFCGSVLKITEEEDDLNDGPFYRHPPANCFIETLIVYPDQVELWNKRGRAVEWAKKVLRNIAKDVCTGQYNPLDLEPEFSMLITKLEILEGKTS